MNTLDRVVKLQEGFVKGATVELERDFLGEGSLFPNSRDPGEPLWVLRPQNVDFENPDSSIRPVIWCIGLGMYGDNQDSSHSFERTWRRNGGLPFA